MMLSIVTTLLLSAPQFIAAQSGVRLRATAAADGTEVVKLPIGTKLTQLDASGAPVTIDGKQGTWEHVTTADGKQGYIFSTGVTPLDPSNSAKAYLDLWEARRANKKLTFPERADLYNMLEHATADVETPSQTTVDLQVARARALKAAVGAIGMDKADKQPFKGFLKERGDNVVYCESCGHWMAEPTPMWKLADDYRAKGLDAEALAWEAASTLRSWECEGFIGCYVSSNTMSFGKYLEGYPSGPHAPQALKELTIDKEAMKQHVEFIPEMAREDIDQSIEAVDKALGIIKTVPASKQQKAAQTSMTTLKAKLTAARPTAKASE